MEPGSASLGLGVSESWPQCVYVHLHVCVLGRPTGAQAWDDRLQQIFGPGTGQGAVPGGPGSGRSESQL